MRIPALLLCAASLFACQSGTTAGPGGGGKADDLASCPANVSINSAVGSARRCFDEDNGQFVPTLCCAEVCEGAGWREQSNGPACAWLDEPGLEDAEVGQFAPNVCCELQEAIACERAELAGGECLDPQNASTVDAACCAGGPECNRLLSFDIGDCVLEQIDEAEMDSERLPITALEALEICTSEADLTSALRDDTCSRSPEAPFCGVDPDEFQSEFLDPCFEALRSENDCALGTQYFDIRRLPNTAIVRDRRLTVADASDLSAAQTEHVLEAVRQSSFDEVANIAEAFAFMDEETLIMTEFFELGNARAFTSYQFSAGGNAFGAMFEIGTGELVAKILDTDLVGPDNKAGCDIPFGVAGRFCESSADCSGLRCQGIVDEHPAGTVGICVDPGLGSESASIGDECTAFDECPLEDGLSCSGIASAEVGSCRPAWMFGTFEDEDVFDIPDQGTLTSDIVVFGLATVAEDASIRVAINHPDYTALRINLVPAMRDEGTLSPVFDGATDGAGMSGFETIEVPIVHPGDEAVNGVWTLEVEDTSTGSKGRLLEWELTFSSRFD